MNPQLYDREGARRLLEDELADSSYQRQFTGPLREAIDAFLDWMAERAFSIGGVDVPFGPLLVLGAVIVTVIIIIVVVRPRLQRGSTAQEAVQIDPQVTAAAFRAHAQECARSGDFNTAAQEAFRAVVRAAEERGVVRQQQGRTATEIAESLSSSYPPFSTTLQRAADLFNRSLYGSVSLAKADLEFIADLDMQLQREPAQHGGSIDGPHLAVPR
ncbi:DUF4129 domain-containing protein [Nesterenkonia natronophila]|uniref:DUF4129 domain-containing protein n=1 Tax=Nesterenkonia natronophila TaxID=2174932 RepID=A0A3A4F0U4_9MICC|nr:DUF4129 domain-containing protein [Nesterenkonia natronophila]RJN31812.1 DUF4129 domain-containing protein [Nesterenkonia natronophila]